MWFCYERIDLVEPNCCLCPLQVFLFALVPRLRFSLGECCGFRDVFQLFRLLLASVLTTVWRITIVLGVRCRVFVVSVSGRGEISSKKRSSDLRSRSVVLLLNLNLAEHLEEADATAA